MDITHTIKHKLTIDNISSYINQPIDSTQKYPKLISTESFPREGSTKFFVEINPNVNEEKYSKCVSLYFWLANCETKKVVAKYRASILGEQGEELFPREPKNKHLFEYCRHACGFAQFVSHKYLIDPENKLIFNDKLHLLLEVFLFENEDISPRSYQSPSHYTYFTWTIDNFGTIIKNGICIDSERFCLTNHENTQFFIEMYPNGKSLEQRGSISVYLRLLSSDDLPDGVKVIYKFSIIDAKGQKFNTNESEIVTFLINTGNGWLKYISHQDLYGTNLLQDDQLSLLCQIKFIEDSKSAKIQNWYDFSYSEIKNSAIALGLTNTNGSIRVTQQFINQNWKIIFITVLSSFVFVCIKFYFD